MVELQFSDEPRRFYKIVLYGCLHNTAYDAQCEGDRGWYLYQAIKLIDDKEAFEFAIIQKYFRNNWDHWLFVQLTSIKDLRKNADQHHFHGAAMEVEEALASVRQKPKTDILMYLYHHTPCSCCRYRIVQFMHKKEKPPDMVLHECRFDFNKDIRDFTEGIIKSRSIEVVDGRFVYA
ncbi:MAG TPA: hypothetical protein DCY75_01105 [Clostridiales bacterium]|nr:hypothetical protein [Clostridiales bacterium]